MNKGSSSLVWDYFVKNDENKLAVCSVCKRWFSYKTSITNLKKHLRYKHKDQYNEMLRRSDTRCGRRFLEEYNDDVMEELVNGISLTVPKRTTKCTMHI